MVRAAEAASKLAIAPANLEPLKMATARPDKYQIGPFGEVIECLIGSHQHCIDYQLYLVIISAFIATVCALIFAASAALCALPISPPTPPASALFVSALSLSNAPLF